MYNYFETLSYCCPIHKNITAPNKNSSPNITDMGPQPDTGFVNQYIDIPPENINIPANNNIMLNHLIKCIFTV